MAGVGVGSQDSISNTQHSLKGSHRPFLPQMALASHLATATKHRDQGNLQKGKSPHSGKAQWRVADVVVGAGS